MSVTDSPRLDFIRAQMAKAIKRFDDDARHVELIAVSKTFDAEHIVPLIAAGQRVFGENRVQEAKSKWPALKAQTPDINLHLIGPLQSNKVKDAVELFDVIESLDREKLAVALSKEIDRTEKNLPLFVQVNIGRESQKAGIDPSAALEFVRHCQSDLSLNIVGLMCIPPAAESPGAFFAQLAELRRQAELPYLSMGMSADYQTAIEMGATHVRVGSALFGKRGQPNG